MNRKKAAILLACLFAHAALPAHAAEEKIPLNATMPIIPAQIESTGTGPFVDLVKIIVAQTDRPVSINLMPWNRSIENVINGKADFHIPAIRVPADRAAQDKYIFSSESLGKVSFVIYSNIKRPITKEMIINGLSQPEPYPYTLEAPPLVEHTFEFPTLPSSDIDNSLQKVLKGRIDALIWAQEESDSAVKKLGLKNIVRNHLADYEDTIIIADTEKGRALDKLLSKAIAQARQSGALSATYEKVHRPYNNWQPSEMKTEP